MVYIYIYIPNEANTVTSMVEIINNFCKILLSEHIDKCLKMYLVRAEMVHRDSTFHMTKHLSVL